MTLKPETFDRFFEEVHGNAPFPWQSRLAREVCDGYWPSPIALPTAAGKTAAIDIAAFALACGAPNAPRRIFFVIDRRIVVDEATERALKLAERLRQSLRSASDSVLREAARTLKELAGPDAAEPLMVAKLRGGMLQDNSWLRSPLQPMVCCSTVDQVGSALLFRGYGARSPFNWPIQAGLVSHDALFLVDEAHTSQAFVETARSVAERYRGWAEQDLPGRITVVQLSATPTEPPQMRDEEDDRSHSVLGPRLRASKPALLVPATRAQSDEDAEITLVEQLCAEARRHATAGARRIGVITNRVATARAVHARLSSTGNGDCLLLTGRVRPFERDRLLRRWHPVLEGSKLPETPVFVAATQCIEVGANFDFDALATEAASIDALQQRFGRLNRFGRWQSSPASIALREDAKGKPDPVYGAALAATWRWLLENATTDRKSKGNWIDFGVLALRVVLPAGQQLATMCAPRKSAPVLLPSHLDVLSQTSPEPAPPFDVSPFLHGPESASADVAVVWRADLNTAPPTYWSDLVAIAPPAAGESLLVPFYAVRQWLCGLTPGVVADLEGAEAQDEEAARSVGRPVLCWQGMEDSAILAPHQIRPGMTLVLPTSYGGCDMFGWNPDSTVPVADLGDLVSLYHRGRAVLRLGRELFEAWPSVAGERVSEAIESSLRNLNASLVLDHAREFLRLVETDHSLRSEVRQIARLLIRDRKPKLVLYPATADSDQPELAAIVGSRRWRLAPRKSGEDEFLQEDLSSSLTVEVGLEPHLIGVAQRARAYGTFIGLPDRLVSTLSWAGRFHDVGKADPRFQAWLRGGSPWVSGEELLAKSGFNDRDLAAIMRARQEAGFPVAGRHELESVALAQQLLPVTDEDIDIDLLLHLIASHHGRCRPFAPVVVDEAPVELCYSFSGHAARALSRHGLERLDSGISERYWRLTRRYGWFGLAWLEMLLRLADHRQSETEQTSAGVA